jgi:hypothetical protein
VWFESQWPYFQPLLVPECKDIAYEPEPYNDYELREGEVDGKVYNNVTFKLWHGKGNVTDELNWKECVSSSLTCGIIIDVTELTDDVIPEIAAWKKNTC